MVPKTAPLMVSIQSALHSRIAFVQKEQQMDFLKQDFCSALLDPQYNVHKDCKSKRSCLLSALSHRFRKTSFSSFADHLGNLIFSPDIPTLIRNCGNVSHPDFVLSYFLDYIKISSEIPVSMKSYKLLKYAWVPYIVDSESFDFLTCNSMKPKIVYTMFVQYFDSYVWLCLVFSIVCLTALIQMKHKVDWGDLVLNFVGILLNISTSIGKVITGNKWSFVHWLFFIWFFGAFVLNNWYQIVVISDFIKPATIISPWDHIFSLHEFSVVTPLGENSPHLDSLRNFTIFQETRALNIIWIHYTHEKSLIRFPPAVYNDTILYNSAINNHSNAVLAWGYSAFGHSIWSMFSSLCKCIWRGLNSPTCVDEHGCKGKNEMLANLDPVHI